MLFKEEAPKTPKQTFNKENLDTYLKELSKAYKKEYGKQADAEIVLIGGAAILAGYDFREMTTDVDAIIRANASMKSAINNVGDSFGLPNGWLNTDFMKTSSYSPKLAQYSKHYKTFSGVLNVRLVTGEYLIAMKLCSFRPYKKDQSDVLGVLQYHQNLGTPITMEQIESAVKNLYGTLTHVPVAAWEFVEQALQAENLIELFHQVSEQESIAKTTLIEFEENYKGVLNSDNLQEILSQLTNKMN